MNWDAEILAVGTELTSGKVVNANAVYLARRLEECGIACRRHVAVLDDGCAIVEAIQESLGRARLLVVTGGLGPTVDDITMAAIARAVGRRLVRIGRVARAIGAFYRAHHRRLNPLALRQAHLPDGGVALPNPAGTAPGLWLELDGRVLVALPGVPHEMRAIMERSVLPKLRTLAGRPGIVSRTLRVIGLVELQIQAILKQLALPPEVQFGLYPHLRTVDVRLTARASSSEQASRLADRAATALRRRLGAAVYGTGEQTLEEVVGHRLVQQGKTLALAESCTGGLVADRLTNVPGSSRYLLMSVVAYENGVKARWLGVPRRALERFGAVSEPVAKAMAQGARGACGADIGIGITGIAGPTGSTPKKPVGLVYMALAGKRTVTARRYLFHGDRLAVKHQAAQMALDWLRRHLR
ncbi:MAG: competence/damage-inducible protein A [Candidatus Omnitrophica bacterium]|nr:competence/damage-inducible protein A [Candidatus Omnitrophota bacterium]